ncbi:MAG: seg [archaeon GW2011_AR5]|nr:MAG: seg [archaeon GW2011_AR5]
MLQKYNFYRVLSVFLSNPSREFGWKELSEKLKLGPPSTKKYIDELKKEGIIEEKKFGARSLYRANRESRKFRLFMKFDMVLRLEDSGLLEFLDKFYGYPAVLLFGSRATGEAVEGSDIDIAVITESKKDADISNFEKKFRQEIQLFRFSKEEFMKLRKENPSIYDGLRNGIVISGRLDVS